jgi:monovalent cation/hydrogen antiporter
VIFVTLVVQGLTLAPLVRALGLASKPGFDCEELEARRLMLEAALAQIQNRDQGKDLPDSAGLYDDLAKHYAQQLATVQPDENNDVRPDLYARYLDISRELLDVERDTAIRLRDEGRINDEVLRQLENELDLSYTRLNAGTRIQRESRRNDASFLQRKPGC